MNFQSPVGILVYILQTRPFHGKSFFVFLWRQSVSMSTTANAASLSLEISILTVSRRL